MNFYNNFSQSQVYCEDPIINLPNGKIRGQMVKSRVDDSFTFYSYQGIPFAAPPIGKYRFLVRIKHTL